MSNWNTKATAEIVQKTIEALKNNTNIEAEFVQTKEEAKEKVLSLIPKGAEVMNMTSITLEQLGIPQVINESGEYDSVRNKLNSMNRETQNIEMQKLGSAPEYAVGSVHAITQDGQVVVVSNTGSQLPAYVYGSAHVIWVVGVQKIVNNLDDAMKRIEEHIFPLESVRLRKAYNLPDTVNSNISKILIVKKEFVPGRVHIIFVNDILGF